MVSKQQTFSKSLPQSLWRAELVRQQEAALAEKYGLSLSLLMQRAGQAAFDWLRERWPEAQSLLILAGAGNNGGDGYVIARLAKEQGMQVQLVTVGEHEQLPAEASDARDAWLQAGGEQEQAQWADWSADLVVDCLLGIGASGEVREPIASLISQINHCGRPVLSVDIPSGLCGNTGKGLGQVVHATSTITFIAAKQGLFTGHAPEVVGELVFADLGLDDAFEQLNKSCISLIDSPALVQRLPSRRATAHKGQFGRTAVLGGNIGMPGAIRLAGEASLRAGSGLVNVLTRGEHQLAVISGRPELMVAAIEAEQYQVLNSFLEQANSIVIGPGLGKDAWAKFLLQEALKHETNTLVDADGLNLLPQFPQWRKNWILTPHPGEAARLLSCSVAEIEEDRITAARNIQQNFGGVCVLKGAGTVIAGDDAMVKVANVGNPGMASGGMGDVLSGIIGGLMAQFADDYDLFGIACLGVSLHGMAADLAASKGQRGMLASDLMPYLRTLVNPDLEQ